MQAQTAPHSRSKGTSNRRPCMKKVLDSRVGFVLAPKYRCSTRDRDAMDRSFSGAVGGAATEPRSGAGTAFLRRAPLGSNPGAGCCTARASAHGASTGRDRKRKGELGNVYRRAGRLEAPLLNLRGVVQALRSLDRGESRPATP